MMTELFTVLGQSLWQLQATVNSWCCCSSSVVSADYLGGVCPHSALCSFSSAQYTADCRGQQPELLASSTPEGRQETVLPGESHTELHHYTTECVRGPVGGAIYFVI